MNKKVKDKCPQCNNDMYENNGIIIEEARSETVLFDCSDCGFFYGKHS